MISLQGAHFVQDIILAYARWYVAYLLSSYHGEALMDERSVSVDHCIINH
jgi:transposase-like protein